MDGNITTTAKTETFATEDDIFDLYDEYCHTEMERRDFLTRAAALTLVGGVSGLAMAQALLPRYANAQMISFTDKRMTANYVTYDSPGGNSGKMRGYLVSPRVTAPPRAHPPEPLYRRVARRARSKGSSPWHPTGCTRSAAIPAMTMTARNCSAASTGTSCRWICSTARSS